MTFHILGIIVPTDELIFFRGIETTNQVDFPLFTEVKDGDFPVRRVSLPEINQRSSSTEVNHQGSSNRDLANRAAIH